MDLVRPLSAIFWDLRGCWGTGRRVVLVLDADVPRVEGHVLRVSAADAFVDVGGTLVPADRILSVSIPSRLGDSTFRDGRGESWAGPSRRPYAMPGQGEIDLGGGRGC